LGLVVCGQNFCLGVQNMLEIMGKLPWPVAFCVGAGGGCTMIALKIIAPSDGVLWQLAPALRNL
jgi:hypothetical protein